MAAPGPRPARRRARPAAPARRAENAAACAYSYNSVSQSVISPFSRSPSRALRRVSQVIRFRARALGPTNLYAARGVVGALPARRTGYARAAFGFKSDPPAHEKTNTLEFTTVVHGAPPQYAPNVVHPSRQPPASPRTSCARWLHVHFAAAAAVGMAPPHAWHGRFGLPDGRVRPVGAHDHAHIP